MSDLSVTGEDEGAGLGALGERPLLIRLDAGFISLIEAERDLLTGGTGHKLPRTAMIRMLLKEALTARARSRGERPPVARLPGVSDQ